MRAIEPGERALAKPEAMPVRERGIVDFVQIGVHASRGDLVQQRLPQVRRALVDQRDLDAPSAAVAIAERGGQRQPAGAAAYDDDSMRDGVCFHLRADGKASPVRQDNPQRTRVEYAGHRLTVQPCL